MPLALVLRCDFSETNLKYKPEILSLYPGDSCVSMWRNIMVRKFSNPHLQQEKYFQGKELKSVFIQGVSSLVHKGPCGVVYAVSYQNVLLWIFHNIFYDSPMSRGSKGWLRVITFVWAFTWFLRRILHSIPLSQGGRRLTQKQYFHFFKICIYCDIAITSKQKEISVIFHVRIISRLHVMTEQCCGVN